MSKIFLIPLRNCKIQVISSPLPPPPPPPHLIIKAEELVSVFEAEIDHPLGLLKVKAGNIDCSNCVCRSFMVFLIWLLGKNGFCGKKMENRYLSLLEVYKVQILSRSLHKINFLLPFSNKNANMNNFALMVAFCIFRNLILKWNMEFLYTFFIYFFVSKYCVIKMHFLDHLSDAFKWYASF